MIRQRSTNVVSSPSSGTLAGQQQNALTVNGNNSIQQQQQQQRRRRHVNNIISPSSASGNNIVNLINQDAAVSNSSVIPNNGSTHSRKGNSSSWEIESISNPSDDERSSEYHYERQHLLASYQQRPPQPTKPQNVQNENQSYHQEYRNDPLNLQQSHSSYYYHHADEGASNSLPRYSVTQSYQTTSAQLRYSQQQQQQQQNMQQQQIHMNNQHQCIPYDDTYRQDRRNRKKRQSKHPFQDNNDSEEDDEDYSSTDERRQQDGFESNVTVTTASSPMSRTGGSTSSPWIMNQMNLTNSNNQSYNKYHSLLRAIEQPRLEDHHVTFRTPLHVPDKEYQYFLTRGIHRYQDSIYEQRDRKVNGFKVTQSCCAKTCAFFSLTGIIFLILVGILLDTQPLYIKGSLPKISLQSNEQSKLVKEYLVPIRGTSERLPMAKNAYQAALVYMMTFTISLYFIYQEQINAKLGIVWNSAMRIVSSNRMIKKLRVNASIIRQRIRIVTYRLHSKRNYDNVLLDDQSGSSGVLPIYHHSIENNNMFNNNNSDESNDSTRTIFYRYLYSIPVRISHCLSSWSGFLWKNSNSKRGSYQHNSPNVVNRRRALSGGINGNIQRTLSGSGKDPILPLHSTNANNATHLLGNSYQKGYTTIPSNNDSNNSNGIWKATKGTIQQMFNRQGWYPYNHGIALTTRQRKRRTDKQYIHKKHEV